jgi:hypothetical protein
LHSAGKNRGLHKKLNLFNREKQFRRMINKLVCDDAGLKVIGLGCRNHGERQGWHCLPATAIE